jgi:Bacterial PH domain
MGLRVPCEGRPGPALAEVPVAEHRYRVALHEADFLDAAREPPVLLARSRGVTVREYRMARFSAVGTAVFAVVLAGLGVTEIIGGAMGWVPSGWAYAEGAGLIAGGCLTAKSLRRATWADETGLHLRGMFRSRVVPWSHVRYFQVGKSGNSSIVEAGLADSTVQLPGTDGRPDRTRRFAADLMAVNPGQPWLAIGLDLTLATTAEGSRQTPLLVTEQLRYRASWALPDMTGTGQAGAPLLCSSAFTLTPGASARAVIIPQADAHMSQWRLLSQGDRLRLLEGPRVRGHAVVRWTENTSLPVPSTDTDRFSIWAKSSDDRPRPA